MEEALGPGKENTCIQVWYLPMKHLCLLTESTSLGISMMGIPVPIGMPGPQAAHLSGRHCQLGGDHLETILLLLPFQQQNIVSPAPPG